MKILLFVSDIKTLTTSESEDLLQWLQVTLGYRVNKAKVLNGYIMSSILSNI